MKFTLLILLLFAKSCSSQETEKREDKADINNEVLVEFTKPIEGFEVKINWKLIDSISGSYNDVVGPAKLKFQRLTDNKIFEINIENFNIDDSISGINMHERFKEKNVPNVLQLEIHPNIYFKDINFDNKNEIIIDYSRYETEIDKRYDHHKIFEFTNNDELIEIDYFPIGALDWSGEIDYNKQEVIEREYFNCCSYGASYFKYDINSKERFVFYKSEDHNVDGRNGNDEITVEEKGKKKVTIFKKGE